MLKVTGHQEGGWVGQFPEGTVGGVWHWSLLGPVPQSLDKDDGGDAEFLVDETVDTNLGEYTLSVQRLDSAGGSLGDSQSSASFIISGETPPVLVDIEVAGLVTVSITTAEPAAMAAKKK